MHERTTQPDQKGPKEQCDLEHAPGRLVPDDLDALKRPSACRHEAVVHLSPAGLERGHRYRPLAYQGQAEQAAEQ